MDASQTPLSRLRLLALTLALTVLSGCVSTSILDRWKDPAYAGPPLHKVLVVGVQKDAGRRRLWEDAMVVALTRQGVQATASWKVFPDKPPSGPELAAAAERDGFDGVMASHFVAASQSLNWMPGYADMGWGWGWGWPYFGYWGGMYDPGFLETEDRTDYQTDVFTVDASGGKLIWTGITRSIDLSSTRSITNDLSRVLVPALTKEGILASPPTGKAH